MVLRLQRMYIDCNKNECRVEHLRVHGVKISPLRGESRKENLFEDTLLLESSMISQAAVGRKIKPVS
jgi:hypothetical protein